MMRNATAPAHDTFMSALAAERGQPLAATTPQLRVVDNRPPAGSIHLGDADVGGAVALDLTKLLVGRLLVQGASGAGKSWTLRRLLEQTARMIQQVVVDPEGEFRSIADTFGHLYVECHLLDTAGLATLARRIREHRLSVVLDMSDMDREAQMQAVAAVFQAFVNAPREQWHPVLVAVDEAHLFAPFGGASSEPSSVRKASIGAITDLMSRGRKRGLAGVLATQRLARLAKSVVSEAHNYLIGLNTLDLDIRRAAETIGWNARRAFDRLPLLEPGDFVAVGPAFSRSPAVLRVGAVETRHTGEAPSVEAPPVFDPVNAAKMLALDDLLASSANDREIRGTGSAVQGLKAVREFIRDPAFPVAGRIWSVLAPLAPEGASVAELAAYLEISADQAAAGLALLDGFGTVDFMGEGDARAVRLERGMRP
jgi:hypothetical protein